MNPTSALHNNEHLFISEKDVSPQNFYNVPYGPDDLQVMDIYLPKGRSSASTKSLILIHGGGWNSGSKGDFVTYIESFKHRLPHYAIFNINYRLVSSGHLFPTQEQDVKAAVDFINSKADEYRVDKNSFVLLGVSAGGHLALLQAYKYSRPNIKAVIDYFGPADLMAMYQKPWHPLVPLALQMVTGTTPQKNKGLYEASSPAEYIRPGSPPTLILHGSLDAVVDVSQSLTLAKKLGEAGVPHQLKIFSGERHGRWNGPALKDSFDTIEKFLQQVS